MSQTQMNQDNLSTTEGNDKEKIYPPFKEQKISPPGLEAKMDPRPYFKGSSYEGSHKLEGKIVLITGGDSGIGRAVGVLAAREGAKIAFTYLPVESIDAQETVELVQAEGSQAIKIEVDLTAPDASEEVINQVIEKFGQLDVLVNNAAFQKHVNHLEDLSFEQFKYTFEVNIFAYFKMVKAALPYLKPGASIINTGSILGYEGAEHLVDYAATKGAIHSFTKSLAQLLAKKDIRVNSVAPGPVWTPLNPAERTAEETKNFGQSTLFGRPAQPEEIAPAFIYLASPVTGSYITGETINLFGSVSGGN